MNIRRDKRPDAQVKALAWQDILRLARAGWFVTVYASATGTGFHVTMLQPNKPGTQLSYKGSDEELMTWLAQQK